MLTDRHLESQRRQDRRAGEIVAMLYNVHRDQKKDATGKGWQDFFPEWQQRTPVMTDDQMFEAMQMWARVTAPLES